jgi:predicted anti-sigma-YlaC factor YlaD
MPGPGLVCGAATVKVLLDCKAVSKLISEGQDEKLPTTERARMRLHFVMCERCRNVDEQLAFMRQAMHRLGREEPDLPVRQTEPSDKTS